MLIIVVAIAICAVVCGAEVWQQIEAFGKNRRDWLNGFLNLPQQHAVPSQCV